MVATVKFSTLPKGTKVILISPKVHLIFLKWVHQAKNGPQIANQ
jgi:hypothetical protein